MELINPPPNDDEHRVFVRNRGRPENNSNMSHVSFLTTRELRTKDERELSRQERIRRKRKRAQQALPVLLEAMKEWSVTCAFRKAGLHYQAHLSILKEFEEFNIALRQNIERQKKARFS